MGVEHVAIADFEHAFLGAQGDGAGEFDELVNAADAKDHENCADPKFKTAEAKIISEGARDSEAAGDAEEVMNSGVELDGVPGFSVEAESAEIMEKQREGEKRVMTGMEREPSAKSEQSPKHWAEEEDGEAVGGWTVANDRNQNKQRRGDDRDRVEWVHCLSVLDTVR